MQLMAVLPALFLCVIWGHLIHASSNSYDSMPQWKKDVVGNTYYISGLRRTFADYYEIIIKKHGWDPRDFIHIFDNDDQKSNSTKRWFAFDKEHALVAPEGPLVPSETTLQGLSKGNR
jgi:hypothetical protein